jgi:hypothetical protein
MRIPARILLSVLTLALSGCAYTLQNSHSPLSEKENIHRIYIRPLVNNTYKVGVENTVFNALLKNIVAHRRVAVVGRPEEADAVLEGTVTLAQYTFLAATQINTTNVSRAVTSQYSATLGCSFILNRRNPAPGQRKALWGGGFQRSLPFNSSVQAGTRGETTAPLNESEFDRVLADLAGGMVAEVHESMLAMF